MPSRPNFMSGVGQTLQALSALSPNTAPLVIQQQENRRRERLDAAEKARARKQLAQDQVQTLALQALQSGRVKFEDLPGGVFSDPRIAGIAQQLQPEREPIARIIEQGGRQIGIDQFGETVADLGELAPDNVLVNPGGGRPPFLVDRRTRKVVKVFDGAGGVGSRSSAGGSTGGSRVSKNKAPTAALAEIQALNEAKAALAQDPNNEALKTTVAALSQKLKVELQSTDPDSIPSPKNGALSVVDAREHRRTFTLMNMAIKEANELMAMIQGDPNVVGVPASLRVGGAAVGNTLEAGANAVTSFLLNQEFFDQTNDKLGSDAVKKARAKANALLGLLKPILSGDVGRLSDQDMAVVKATIGELEAFIATPSGMITTLPQLAQMAERRRDISKDILDKGTLQAGVDEKGMVKAIMPVKVTPEDRNIMDKISDVTGKPVSDVMVDLRATMSETGIPWADLMRTLSAMSDDQIIRGFTPDQ